MMRTLILVTTLAASTAAAQPVSVAPWMTGQHLLELYALPAGAKSEADLTPRQYVDLRSAQLYLHGVHDATEGREWCYDRKYRPKPDVIEDAALAALRALPPEQLKRSAAELVVAAWRSKWPCGGKP
jgi:hypothetical protein